MLGRELREWQERDEPRSARALWGLAWVEFWAGRWKLAAADAARAHDISIQYRLEVPEDHLPIAVIAVHRGQLELAREHSERALELAEEQFGFHPPQHLAVLGLAALWSGNPAAAGVWLDKAHQRAAALEWGEPSVRWWSADYIELLLELGRIDDAVRILDSWEADATRVARVWVLAHATRSRGLVAAARGDVEHALALLAQAIVEHEAVGDPFGRARALLALGTVRRRSRKKRPAREAIEAAIEGFEAIGALRLGGQGARRTGAGRRAQARGRADGSRAPRRGPGRRESNQPGGRSRALPRRTDSRQPPDPHLRQARCPLAHRARPPDARRARSAGQSSDVLTFPRRRPRRSVECVPSYLVETYLGRNEAGERAARERRARSAAEELTQGKTRVRFDRSIHVPQDEICFYVFDAASARDAADAAQRAGLDPIRVVGAVSSGKEEA